MTTATVYLFYAADDTLLYVGCSRRGFSRTAEHGSKEWWMDVARAEFEHFEDEADARMREYDLIRTRGPRHNLRAVKPGRPTVLRQIRQRRGDSPAGIAALLGISVEQYRRYELGHSMLSMPKVLALSRHFGVTADELVGRASPEPTEAAA